MGFQSSIVYLEGKPTLDPNIFFLKLSALGLHSGLGGPTSGYCEKVQGGRQSGPLWYPDGLEADSGPPARVQTNINMVVKYVLLKSTAKSTLRTF